MKQYVFFVILLVLTNGCSTSVVENKNDSKAVDKTTSVNANLKDSAAMEEFMKPSSRAPEQNSNANLMLGSTFGKQVKRNPNGRAAAPPIDPNAKRMLANAPDNSVIYTEMNQQGTPIETRIFKNHPQLQKVERTYSTIERPEIKVYLKNGKIIDVPGDKFDNILNAPAKDIAAAAAVAVP